MHNEVAQTKTSRGRIIWSKNLNMLQENLIKIITPLNLKSLSRSEYESIRKDSGRDSLPSYQTILSLTPEATSFSESLKILSDGKINLSPILKSKTGQEITWNNDSITDTLYDWIDQQKNENPSHPDLRQVSYDRWRQNQDSTSLIPSSSTIYSRFGNWSKAIKSFESRNAND